MSLWNFIRGVLANEPSAAQPSVTPVAPAPVAAQPAPPPLPQAAATTWRYALAPIFDLLGHTEGTDKRRGYNETLAYGLLTNGDVNLQAMTLLQIDNLQTQMLDHPKNKWNSSALGRYQIVRKTLRVLRAGISQSSLFTADLQDLFALKLLVGRGLLKWLEGRITTTTFINELAKEWASVPNASGNGHYSSQRVGATVQEVVTALGHVKLRTTAYVQSEIERLAA